MKPIRMMLSFGLIFLLTICLLYGAEPIRKWRTRSGKSFSAAWDIEKDTGGDVIRLIVKGKGYSMDLSDLCDEDQAYVRGRRDEQGDELPPELRPDDESGDGSRAAGSGDSSSGRSQRGVTLESLDGCRKYALLVGVEDYVKLGKLHYTVNDIQGIREQLLAMGFEEQNIYTLTSGASAANRPTKANIDEKIGTIFEKAEEDALVFLAFTGHGVQPKETIYFCAEDTKATDEKTLAETAVSMTEVMDRLSQSAARFKWMVIDACRNDPYARSALGSSNIAKLDNPPKGSAVMLSCAAEEVSYEDEEFKHGLFSYYLIDGLKGNADADRDGAVTLYELADYTSRKTNARAQKMHSKTQQPYIRQDMTNIVLVEDPSKVQAEALYKMSLALLDDGKIGEADAKISEALKLEPENPTYIGQRVIVQQRLASEPDGNTDGKTTHDGPGNDYPAQARKPGDHMELKVKGVDYTFCWCPPGSFTMGSPKTEQGRPHDGEKQREIQLTRGFWLLESEVTQKMWASVMGERRHRGKDDPEFPECELTWNECRDFCEKFSELSHQQVQLPTEAQWEYACRAGTEGPYGGTGYLDDMGWQGGSTLHPVKRKKPNDWGLYDMHGNVFEFCSDWAGDYDMEDLTDPRGPVSGRAKIKRGGSISSGASECRSANRRNAFQGDRVYDQGFRLALIPAEE